MNEPEPNTQNPLLENTLFINLANRTDRCAHIQQELLKIGINAPIRFNAVKTQMGQVGCSMSHMKCLEMAKQAGWEYVFICEDDAVFTNPALLLNRLSKVREIPVWDVVIVGGNNLRPFFPTVYEDFIQVHNCQTTTAYIVKRAYYDTLIQNIKESLERLLREPKMKHLFSLDIYWKSLQIKDTWLMAIPATVSQLDGVSDIEGRRVSYNQAMMDYEKKWMDGPMIQRSPPPLFMEMPISYPVVVEPTPKQTPVANRTGWGKGFLNTMPKQGSV